MAVHCAAASTSPAAGAESALRSGKVRAQALRIAAAANALADAGSAFMMASRQDRGRHACLLAWQGSKIIRQGAPVPPYVTNRKLNRVGCAAAHASRHAFTSGLPCCCAGCPCTRWQSVASIRVKGRREGHGTKAGMAVLWLRSQIFDHGTLAFKPAGSDPLLTWDQLAAVARALRSEATGALITCARARTMQPACSERVH